MAEANSTNDLRYLPSNPAAKRAIPNLSSGLIVMVLSGLVAVVAFFSLTQSNAQRFRVAVVSGDLAPGQVLDASHLGSTEVDVERAQLDRLVLFDKRDSVSGWIVDAPLHDGDLLQRSDVAAPATASGLRSMSIPVEPSHAVAGALKVGDHVDVLDASRPAYAVQDVVVVAAGTAGGGIAGGGDYSVTVGVTADDAVRLSDAIKNGKIDVVRSTGAPPVAAGPPPAAGGRQ